MSNRFKLSRYLVGQEIEFLEIRCGVSSDGHAVQLTRWILTRGVNGNPQLLNLCFRDSLADVEELYFEEGYLKLNGDIGAFIEKFNSAQHQLELSRLQDICPELLHKVCGMLKEGTF